MATGAGRFVEIGQLDDPLHAAGFSDVFEERASVPWWFEDEDKMLVFCRSLFGLEAVTRTLVAGIRDPLSVTTGAGGTRIEGSLCNASARKAWGPGSSS